MICVDTHVLVWWQSEPRRLSPRARRAIDTAVEIGISAISCWEVAMLVAKGRLELDRDIMLWLQQALAQPRVVLFPLTPEIAVASTRLKEDFHGDPMDRILAATSLHYRMPLVTKDERLRGYRPLTTIW